MGDDDTAAPNGPGREAATAVKCATDTGTAMGHEYCHLGALKAVEESRAEALQRLEGHAPVHR